MLFYTQPVVTLVASTAFHEPAHLPVEWVGQTSDPEMLVEYAGRMCYMSQHNPAQRTTTEYINNILMQGHGSVLEHGVYSFLLEGISRSCSHELVRHRAGFSVSQLSQRYVNAEETNFVLPPALLAERDLERQFVAFCKGAVQEYTQLAQQLEQKFAHIESRMLRQKRAREAARSVLPNATETKLVLTGNIRAWRQMLELRCGEGADLEIQRLAMELLRQLKELAPASFADFAVNTRAGTAIPLYHKV